MQKGIVVTNINSTVDTNYHIENDNLYDKENNPVRTALYGYGRINEYDKNGRVVGLRMLVYGYCDADKCMNGNKWPRQP